VTLFFVGSLDLLKSVALKKREWKFFHSTHLAAHIKFTSDFDKKCDISCEKGCGFEMEATSAKVFSLFMFIFLQC